MIEFDVWIWEQNVCLQVMSNNQYKSVIHRVVTNTEEERISIDCIAQPPWDFPLCTCPELIDEDHPQIYKPIIGKEYQAVKLEGHVCRPQKFFTVAGDAHLELRHAAGNVFTSTSDPSVVAARAWSWWQQDFFKLITQTTNPPSHPTKNIIQNNHKIVLNAKFVLWICRKFEEEDLFSSAVCSHSNTYISTSFASSNSPTQRTLVCYPSPVFLLLWD